MVKQDGRTCIRENKGADEHVYCLKDGKTGWQNLFIGKKIEKRGDGTCILFKIWRNRLAEPVYQKKYFKKGAAEHVNCLKDGKTGWQNLYTREKGAAEHVYCLKDGKTGWQNLYIGEKIKNVKTGWQNLYTR